MLKRIAALSATLAAALILASSGGTPAAAQEKAKQKEKEKEKDSKIKAPKFLYGHDLRVRMGGKPDFDKDTPRIGVEVYLDEPRNAIIAISEAGALAVTPAGSIGMDHACKWLTAHDLSVRKPGELEFTQKTKKFGVELFHDLGGNHLLYASQTAALAFATVPAGLVTDKHPLWHHAFEARVRAHEQTQFESAKKIGIEVYADENTGGSIYITEAGAIATSAVPVSALDPKKAALPLKSLYGLELRARGATEADFTDKTKWIGVEVDQDENANNLLLYISEPGYIATAPNPAAFTGEKGVSWKAAMALKARKGGEKTFDLASAFGVEVFVDNRTGNYLYVCETGSIAVLPKQ